MKLRLTAPSAGPAPPARAALTLLALGLCAGVFIIGACATRKQPVEPAALPAEEGIASHYAERFAGRPTASGAPYQPGAMTAAHRTLPLGTRVRVTRIDRAGKPVAGPIVVLVNDRGPYAKGRIIDLSSEAARRLGLYGGIGRVRVEVLDKKPASR